MGAAAEGGWLIELFAQLPALRLTGPRATGKTTTARRHAYAGRRAGVAASSGRAANASGGGAPRTPPAPSGTPVASRPAATATVAGALGLTACGRADMLVVVQQMLHCNVRTRRHEVSAERAAWS